jgi:ribosomal protein S18 acetylase RimI-like enzyme
MHVRSLGYKTDLMFFGGGSTRILEREEYLSIESPENPTFYWGNFLLFRRPPGEGDFERWEALFRAEFAGSPHVRHRSFGWDDPDGHQGEISPFLEAGYVLEDSVVMTATKVILPERFNPAVTVKRLESDSEWEAATDNQILCRQAQYDSVQYAEYMRRKMASYRALTMQGKGAWFGAFVDGELVGDLGLFVQDGAARFQSVETDPGYRRRGVCRTLVKVTADYAIENMGAEVLILVAKRDAPVIDVYNAVGFRPTERQVGVCWWSHSA